MSAKSPGCVFKLLLVSLGASAVVLMMAPFAVMRVISPDFVLFVLRVFR